MKFAASSTIKRAGAAVALSAALLSATGCGYIYKQPTTIIYSASDGVMTDVADVKLRNIMVIASGSEEDGRMLGTILNDGKEDATVEFAFGSGTKSIKVPAGEQIRLEDEKNTFIVSPAGANPGEMLRDTKVTVNGESSTLNIPVLDGTLEEYATYLPNAAEVEASASATAEETKESH